MQRRLTCRSTIEHNRGRARSRHILAVVTDVLDVLETMAALVRPSDW